MTDTRDERTDDVDDLLDAMDDDDWRELVDRAERCPIESADSLSAILRGTP
jgi:hypothetical protein